VRKSLLVADRSSGRTRFSMLETIRQFAEEQLVARGEASEIRAAHSRYFAGREADIMALWDSPGQREAFDWFSVELANLRTAFRWAADDGDLDVAATIATYAGWLGAAVQTYEPIAWAEELIEPARAVDHPRLASLYVIASQCYWAGRIEAAVGYSEAGQIVLGRSRDAPPYGIEAALGAVYLAIGQPERWAELCRAQLARRRDTHVSIRAWLVVALAAAGSGGEAMDSADGLIEAAEATGNPMFLSSALGAYGLAGLAFRDADPVGALNALGRGLVIAQDSGNRTQASVLADGLALLEAEHGDTASAFDHLTLAIRNLHNAGNTTVIRAPLASLAALFERLRRYEPAATIAGFAYSPLTAPRLSTAITHLRDVLGEATYESLARNGETMTTAEMATYAYDQIDQARTDLADPPESP
jgi:tetratricopeptide (TPR) repeat protein